LTVKEEFEEEDVTLELDEIKNYHIVAMNLVKDYEIGEFIVRAVDNVSLKIRNGKFLCIKGPSGAGKTTLLNLLGGLDTPNKGTIYNLGIKISDMKEESLATFRLINSGFIFQNYNLISTLTAEENVMFPMNLAGMKFKEQRERAVNLLRKMGLGKRREHLPFQLSAGEQQRVAIELVLESVFTRFCLKRYLSEKRYNNSLFTDYCFGNCFNRIFNIFHIFIWFKYGNIYQVKKYLFLHRCN